MRFCRLSATSRSSNRREVCMNRNARINCSASRPSKRSAADAGAVVDGSVEMTESPPDLSLRFDHYFAEPVARQEELHRFGTFEKLLHGTVVEQLSGAVAALLRHFQSLHVLDAKSVVRNRLEPVVRMKECQHTTARPQDLMQPLHHRREQRRSEILQNVPSQYAIEVSFRIIQRLAEKVLNAAGMRLARNSFGSACVV